MKKIEDKKILIKIHKFINLRKSASSNKQFDSLCKIHNPFGYIEKGVIEEVEKSNPDQIIELNWKEFCEKFELKMDIDSETHISQIRKEFDKKYPNDDLNNFYWASASLGYKQIEKLGEIINEHLDFDLFYCFYSLITNLNFERPQEEIFLTDFDDFKNLVNNKNGFSPTMWWNKSLDWLVYTDNDLTSSYVFGDKQLIKKIVENWDLESYKLNIRNLESDFNRNILI